MNERTRTMKSLKLVALCAAGLATHALAEERPMLRFLHLPAIQELDERAHAVEANAPPATNWHVQIEPMARYISPAGDIRIPGGGLRGTEIDLADLNLNSPRLMPGFDLSLRNDAWRLNAIGLFYDVDNQLAVAEEPFTLGGVEFATAQRSNLSHSYTQLDLRLARNILDEPLSPLSDRLGHKARVRVDIEGGLRLYNFEFEFENLDTGARGSDDRTFFEPHAGAKAAFSIYEDITIDLYTNFGFWPVDAEAFSWDIGVGFQWRPVDYFGLQIGYRSTIFLLEEGSGANAFEWAGSYQGLYAGLQLRF